MDRDAVGEVSAAQTTTDVRCGFEDEHATAVTREACCSREPVRTGANDDGIEFGHAAVSPLGGQFRGISN